MPKYKEYECVNLIHELLHDFSLGDVVNTTCAECEEKDNCVDYQKAQTVLQSTEKPDWQDEQRESIRRAREDMANVGWNADQQI